MKMSLCSHLFLMQLFGDLNTYFFCSPWYGVMSDRDILVLS